MQPVFLINPAAGKKNAATWLAPAIRQAAAELRAEPVIDLTQRPGHARALAQRQSRRDI